MSFKISSMVVLLLMVLGIIIGTTATQATDEQYARWSKSCMPLKVYIQSDTNIPGYRDTYPVQVAKAFRQWKVDTKGMVDFTIVNDKKNADIVVSWANKMRKQDFIDQADGHSYVWGITKLGNPTEIILVTSHPMAHNQSLTDNNIYMISLHEIGHALGIWWHTRDPQDIMYPDFIVPSTTANGARKIINKNTGTLSSRDISNVMALYNKNNVTMLDKVAKGTNVKLHSVNNSVIGAVETTGSAAATVSTNSQDLNVDLGTAMAYLKKNPDSYEAYNNIGLVYLENGDFNTAVQYFQKSLSINPHYSKGHFNLALSFSKMKNYAPAIVHYKKYLELEPEGANSENVKKEIERLKQISMN